MLNDKANPASEITTLRSRIVALESDNAALKQECSDLDAECTAVRRERDQWKQLSANCELAEEQVSSSYQLAAAQATNAKLRGYIQRIVDDACQWDTNYPRYLDEALALPNDTTALDARLKEERERMIARYSPDDTAQDWMDKIRGMA